MRNKKNVFSITEIIIIIVVTGVVCSLTTGIIMFSSYKYTNMGDDKALNSFIEAYAKVLDKYYVDVDRNAMIDSAIEGMMNYLDDNYSVFMDNDSASSLTSQLSGKYKGIGIEILGTNEIVTVFDDSPASKAGIKAGDIVTKVNDQEVLDSSETVNLISQKDECILELRRGEETLVVSVTSSMVEKPIVTSELIEENEKKIGYLKVTSFTQNVDSQFKKELGKLEDENIESLIIDLRNNVGGYLDKAENIASMFLDKGKVIYSLSGKNINETTYDKTSEKRNYKVVIITNKSSASASEVLAGALKDSYGATIIGVKSYGKGKVQQLMQLGNGDSVKVTTAEWLRPNGECIDGIGITPDIVVELPKLEEDQEFVDIQKLKAIEILS